jgi:hypothetical protein
LLPKKDQQKFDDLFKEKGIKGQTWGVKLTGAPEGTTAVGLPVDNVPEGDPKVETEIYWRMLRTPRVFRFESIEHMKNFVAAKLSIIATLEKAKWQLSSEAKLPKGWKGDWELEVKPFDAISAWFVEDAGCAAGCQQSTNIVVLKGLAEMLKENRFNDLAAGAKTLTDVAKATLSWTKPAGAGDWIPGEWGWLGNKAHAGDATGLLQGENIVYMGGTYAADATFLDKGVFWGMSSASGGSKKTLNQWRTTVEGWTRENEFPKGSDLLEQRWGPKMDALK